LPLRWVFTYKFDSDGYLIKCKTRICVRGDLQDLTDLFNTRATTLAARVFRALVALVATFDLETVQLDSVNAFLNSVLDEVAYCEFPEGFEENGNCLLLKRALYGFRRSTLLW
jgi:Reverse transcriptase (RNA-dependent DNA polymerase)